MGVIFSAVYLLWSYQRVFFGSITQDKNGALPDADLRERSIMFVMAAIVLWMGIGSPFFTRRTEATTQSILLLMNRPQAVDAGGGHAPDLRGGTRSTDRAAITQTGETPAMSGNAAYTVNLK